MHQNDESFVIRPARREDAAALLGMIHELAAFENEPDAVKASAEALAEAGWGKRRYFDAIIAEDTKTKDASTPHARALGFALFYRTFSTWEGRHGIFVEDLYVKDAAGH